MNTFRQRFRRRLKVQGQRIDKRYKDRPISKEKYERRMLFIGAVILLYLTFSFLCVMKVVGEWWICGY